MDAASTELLRMIHKLQGEVDDLKRGSMLIMPPPEPGGDAGIVVKITGNAAGGGKYTGRILTGTSTAIATGNETQPEGMTVPGADNCTVLNTEEDGLPTHWLLVGSYAVGKLVASGVVEITGGMARTASPQELASGTADAANTDTWKRGRATSGTDYGDCPVKIPLTSRPVYNSAGDEILYKMVRYLILSADGKPDEVTLETRVAVDSPVLCTDP